MKSAYELAMERLEQKAPTVILTEEQKAEIAEIESSAKARAAEQELFLGEQIAKAKISGRYDEVQSLEKQLVSELRRIQENCEAKKAKVRGN